MRPIKLTLNNIHSFRGPHEIDFSGFDLAVLTGPNGAGKSTLAYDAILFALFGETRDDANSIISEGENVGSVEFEFALGDDRYLVSRQRSRKGGGVTTLSFQIANPDGPGMVVLDGKTAKETQAKINHILRMTPALLRQTAFSGQGNAAAFSQADPAKRKEVLIEILELDHYERLVVATRQASREVQVEAEHSSDGLAAARDQADLQPDIEEQIAANAEQIAKAERDQQGIQGDLATAQEQRVAAIVLRDGAERKRTELAEAQQQLDQAKTSVAERDARLRNLQQVMAGRDNVEAALREAQKADEQAAALLTARDEDGKLAHEADLLMARRAEAEREHGREISRLTDVVDRARSEHAQKVVIVKRELEIARKEHETRLQTGEARLHQFRRQAEPLGRVPCIAKSDGSDESDKSDRASLAATCPLIAGAREAEAEATALALDLEEIRKQRPGAAHEAELKRLEGQTASIAVQDQARLQALQVAPAVSPELLTLIADVAARRAAISYVAGSYEAARARSDKRPALETRMRDIEAAAAQATEVESALNEARKAAVELGDRVAQIKSEMIDPAAIARKLAGIDEEIARCEGLVATLGRDLTQAHAAAGALAERLHNAQAAAERAAQLQTDLAVLQKRGHLLDLLGNPQRGAFSKNGIPALLIDQAVPEIEAAANRVLGELSDGRMSLALRTQAEKKNDKDIRETLDIIIADDRGERAYETYSGGERLKVDLGLRFGLSDQLTARAGTRCELIVLDEACAPLDQPSQDAFAECCLRLAAARRGHKILVITHIERMKDMFPAQIAVSKGDDGSHFEVMA